MTFLQAVNEVLQRLRENTVASVTTNSYSTMIGQFINDTKRNVEDAWDWDAQNVTLTVNTTPGVSNYVVTGSGTKQKNDKVNCTTTGSKASLIKVPAQWIIDQQQLATTTNAVPMYYAWNGTDGTDSKVEFYNTPNGAYSIAFNMNVPQISLSADSDVILVPSDAVVAGAYARALAERGEDGGLMSSEAYALYKIVLGDRIALEQSRIEDYSTWGAV